MGWLAHSSIDLLAALLQLRGVVLNSLAVDSRQISPRRAAAAPPPLHRRCAAAMALHSRPTAAFRRPFTACHCLPRTLSPTPSTALFSFTAPSTAPFHPSPPVPPFRLFSLEIGPMGVNCPDGTSVLILTSKVATARPLPLGRCPPSSAVSVRLHREDRCPGASFLCLSLRFDGTGRCLSPAATEFTAFRSPMPPLRPQSIWQT